ncbi:hypothetical protein SERLA73DRAFT_126817 [Serpula lacrymans var. lacrymans S7.3]|uniref:DUF6589 domain-containing protein n=1 Tax=Serpula lacrymans var. lacrymans (strain S7.3) TaxID=936435 RepID=F8QES0_SERL3|nr:hypothetical protein SERLA73DRAFT_126817 [Serpula lacrymans var. lacrymans S7.3]
MHPVHGHSLVTLTKITSLHHFITPNLSTRAWSNSFPSISSGGPIYSSPVIGSKAEQLATLWKKKSMEMCSADKDLHTQAALQASHTGIFDKILNRLTQAGLIFGDLMVYVFDPHAGQRMHRWDGFFRVRGIARTILDFWASKANSQSGQREVQDWALDYICHTAKKEARQITESGHLQSHKKAINANFFLGFNLKTIRMSLTRAAKKQMTLLSTSCITLTEYSQDNNVLKKVSGLYLYATGAQHQAILVASHLSISESYTNIIQKPHVIHTKLASDRSAKTFPAHVWKSGTLRFLSSSMCDATHDVVFSGLFAVVYDNINMMFCVAEQIVGRNDSQENGTCATVWPLWKASDDDMKLADLEQTFHSARPLSFKDIVLTSAENKHFRHCLTHCVLRIIVNHSSGHFDHFHKMLEDSQPTTNCKIEVHKTTLHPLSAMDIDESTIVGNSEVVEAIMDEIGVQANNPIHSEKLKIFAGDQLSITCLQTLANICAGHEGGFAGFGWGVWMPGLFHAKMADMHDLLVTHWGKPNSGTRNPGSLWFHNTHLHHHPIVLTSLPPFHTCRDLAFVSLYARVLHCLLLVSSKTTLEECANGIIWEKFKEHAETIINKHTDHKQVTALQEERQWTGNKNSISTTGDMVFENAVLFLCDAVVSREFTDAIKEGDSGRMRGTGRTKYAYKMLHLIHNLSCVWPDKVVKVVLKNWLVNPTGRQHSFLEMVAPCVEFLWHLSKTMNSLLGSNQGVTHKPLDLTRDILVLMASLKDHELDNNDLPVPDVITTCLQRLTDTVSNPIEKYNKSFKRLQARRCLQPIVGSSPASNISIVDRVPDLQPSQLVENYVHTAGVVALDNDEIEEEGKFAKSAREDEIEGTLTLERPKDVSLDMDAEDLCACEEDIFEESKTEEGTDIREASELDDSQSDRSEM